MLDPPGRWKAGSGVQGRAGHRGEYRLCDDDEGRERVCAVLEQLGDGGWNACRGA